jgi:phenylacetate-CoA ligase
MLQNLACTWYGFRHQRRYRGRYFWETFEALRKEQWLSTDELLHLQWIRLRQVLRHAYNHVPFYRQQWKRLGITPEDIKTPQDFQRLPLLEKETVRQQADSFISQPFRSSELHSAHTSGTSGSQLTIWLSQQAFEREYSFRWLHYSWSGADMPCRMAYFAGHPVVAAGREEPPFSRHNYAESTLLFSSQHLAEKNLPFYIRELRSFSPELIEGYPSSLYLIAAHLRTSGVRDIRPRAVYTTSETLLDFQRDAIGEAFGCKVFNWYGNTERAGNITECAHGELHVQHAHAIAEVLAETGEPVADGKEGHLAFTPLGNFAFPLIRYRVGDVAVPKHGTCACGRGGRLIERIVGRVEDYVISVEGRYFGRLDHIFKDTENVREAQIVQDRLDHVTLRIVPRPEYSSKDAVRIVKEAKARLGESFRIEVKLEEAIERGPTGKFRFIVSQLRPEDKKNLFVDAVFSQSTKPQLAANCSFVPPLT